MKKARVGRTKSVTVRLDIEINDRLDDYCADTRFSKSLLVNSALNYFVGLPDERKFEVIKDYVILSKKGKPKLPA
jgi:predicted transcriptional regulator